MNQLRTDDFPATFFLLFCPRVCVLALGTATGFLVASIFLAGGHFGAVFGLVPPEDDEAAAGPPPLATRLAGGAT